MYIRMYVYIHTLNYVHMKSTGSVQAYDRQDLNALSSGLVQSIL